MAAAPTGAEARPAPKNDLMVRTARGARGERAPVWAMRQAGRYLPEFREVRVENEFFKVCRTPELASEVTLQPLRRFEGLLDAVVIFSDILIVPQAMGLECIMVPGKGPTFPLPLKTTADMARLTLRPEKAAFDYLAEAIRVTRRKMEDAVPVIGFCGGPWTLMAYMVDGGGSRTFADSKRWLYTHPAETRELLEALTDTCVTLLHAQWEAGASLLQVFESSAGELPPHLFREFALPCLRAIAEGVRARCAADGQEAPPLILFARGAHFALEELQDAGYDVVGLDASMDPAEARRRAPRARAFQGNLDPGALYGPPEVIDREVGRMMRAFGDAPLIANLGWGMHPTHDPEHLRAFFEAVHRHSRRGAE